MIPATNQQQDRADRVNKLWRSHRRYMKSLKTAKRKIRMLKLVRFIAWGLIFFDAWFSYNVILTFSDSQEFALFSSFFIATLQWVISNAIFTRSLGSFMAIDKDKDGHVSFSEALRWGITATAVVVAYVGDIITNVIGIDARGLGGLALAIPGIPDWDILALICAYLFAALLCFGDEILQYLADDTIADIEEEIPQLKERAAIIEAKLAAAGEFSDALIDRAAESGRQRGLQYRI